MNLKLFFLYKIVSLYYSIYSSRIGFCCILQIYFIYICKTKHSPCDHNQACQMRMLYYFNWRSSNHVTDVNGDDTRKLSTWQHDKIVNIYQPFQDNHLQPFHAIITTFAVVYIFKSTNILKFSPNSINYCKI